MLRTFRGEPVRLPLRTPQHVCTRVCRHSALLLVGQGQYELLRQLIDELPLPSDPPLIDEIGRVFGVEGRNQCRSAMAASSADTSRRSMPE